MSEICDIVLNLLDSSRIYEFFEWSAKDNIEEIEKILLFKVDSNTLLDIINNIVKVDNEFLDKIYQETEVIDDFNIKYIDYACLFSNGEKTIAVEFNDNGESLYKSNLLLDEEEEVNRVSNSLEEFKLNYKVIIYKDNNIFISRCDEFKRDYLLKDLDYEFKIKNYSKISYLYDELFKDNNKDIVYKYNRLRNDIYNNYSSKYEKLIKIIKLANKKKV